MNTLTRRSFAMATALVAAVGLAACSGDDDASPSPAETATPPVATAAADPALAGLVGPGCAAYVTEVPKGAGSIAGMANAPLVTAAGKNPLLGTLTKAITGKLNKKVTLTDTLNGGEYTVFAPVDSAFTKLPATTLKKLKTDAPMLVKVLTYHVVAGRLSPAKVAGRQKTVEGGDLTVVGENGVLTVDGAHVVCGGIRTANATVYLIDEVLTPPK